jgi:hypothetical protein
MAVKIPVGYMAPVSIGNFKDAAGNPTTIDSVISTVVSDPSKAEILDIGGEQYVAPRLDGNAVGDNQQVIITCDVRFGPDVREVSFIGTFDVPAGEAATADVTLGEILTRP